MFNATIEWLDKEGFKWKSSEVGSGTATNTVNTLRDVLWYLDGNHETLSSRSCHVPAVFSCFVGFNVPEKLKHRKRTIQSLSTEVLGQD